jgi:hypothetical protein
METKKKGKKIIVSDVSAYPLAHVGHGMSPLTSYAQNQHIHQVHTLLAFSC